jgi:Toxin SymE, type I toxin-antitoxin system
MAEPLVKERRLTVSTLREPRPPRSLYEHRPDRVVPFLRLRGRWLAELGFRRGVKVAVQAEPGRLVITPAPPANAGSGDA